MDNAADIIQTALDILNSKDCEVELVIRDDQGGNARIRWGTLTAIANARKSPGESGLAAYVEVDNYRYSDGEVIAAWTLVDVDYIISISRL